jgi:hypothetical protein
MAFVYTLRHRNVFFSRKKNIDILHLAVATTEINIVLSIKQLLNVTSEFSSNITTSLSNLL